MASSCATVAPSFAARVAAILRTPCAEPGTPASLQASRNRLPNDSLVSGLPLAPNNGERMLDARTLFHYYATGITPAMAFSKPGTGSAYAYAARDSTGRYLDGGKTYKITLPAPIPAGQFWSFMVYDGQTRSMLETDQKLAGLDSTKPGIKKNADGSVTVWFGPKAPAGQEANWVQTMPGKGWNSLLRLYAPLEPWFDKTWKPGDFELVD
jgi:hypothetical protein